MSPTPSFPGYRCLWKPAFVTVTAGTAAAIWFEELLLYIEEILALLFISFMAGIIYLFNILVFKSRMPKGEEYWNIKSTGAKK